MLCTVGVNTQKQQSNN